MKIRQGIELQQTLKANYVGIRDIERDIQGMTDDTDNHLRYQSILDIIKGKSASPRENSLYWILKSINGRFSRINKKLIYGRDEEGLWFQVTEDSGGNGDPKNGGGLSTAQQKILELLSGFDEDRQMFAYYALKGFLNDDSKNKT